MRDDDTPDPSETLFQRPLDPESNDRGSAVNDLLLFQLKRNLPTMSDICPLKPNRAFDISLRNVFLVAVQHVMLPCSS
eukprot:5780547-Amphidinium_carterae.2